MPVAASHLLLHYHGVHGRATLPACHGDCRFLPGACFLGKSPTFGAMKVSLVCGASPNNHRPRNSDISRQLKGGPSCGKSRPYQEKDNAESIDEFDNDIMSSKNGPPISLTSNSRPQATSAPGQREKEIVELFKRVQAQLRARGKNREEKKPEPAAKGQGDRGSVDSLLKLLRKHSVDQRRKNNDEKEHDVDQTRRSNDSEDDPNPSIFGVNSDTQEELKQPPTASFKRPASNFRRRSPVPRMKIEPVFNTNADTDTKSLANDISDAIQKSKTTLDEEAATYEPDAVLPPENISLDDFDVIPDDESDASDTDESNQEYLEPSLENSDVSDSEESHDNSLEPSSSVGSSDIGSLKVSELRELAKSRGIRGYSKMKKNELVVLLGKLA